MAVVSILQIGRNKSPSYYFCHLPKSFRESYAGKSPLSAVYLRFPWQAEMRHHLFSYHIMKVYHMLSTMPYFLKNL